MKKNWKLLLDFLCAMREKNNMSIDYVASQLGMTRNRLINIEMGHIEISLELLMQFSTIYGFTARNLAEIAVVEANDKNYFYNLMKVDPQVKRELKQFHNDLRVCV